MAAAALLLYLTGLILAFGMRTLVARWRTGDVGFRRPDTTRFTPAWWGAVLFVAALLMGAATPALALAGAPPAPMALPPTAGWAGIAVMALGLVLVLASQFAMGASWRIGVDAGERTDLVTAGVFAVARNPVFTAMGAVLAGMAAAVPTWASLAAFTLFTAAVQVQVRLIEEPYLRATHGAAYAARTGRFLPGIGHLPAAPTTTKGR